MNATKLDIFFSLAFALAVIHTFFTPAFHSLSSKMAHRSKRTAALIFHALSEVELVFVLWAFVFLGGIVVGENSTSALNYLISGQYMEPFFVFVILLVAATPPIIEFAEKSMLFISKGIPLPRGISFYITTLILGPLLGSIITEPAAMAVCALILRKTFFIRSASNSFKYVTLALLFVNISIGGTLTPFAAPPVVMVARKWDWDLFFMLQHFGWKSFIAITLNTLLAAFILKKDLKITPLLPVARIKLSHPLPVLFLNLSLLIGVVIFAHDFLRLFLTLIVFVFLAQLSPRSLSPLKLKESLFVGLFLAGLVILGGKQTWWLEPLLSRLDHFSLFLGSTLLTAITDNAALTYLGSLVSGLSEEAKYALVSGAVTGGGLTVIANAPNPAGLAILKDTFEPQGMNPLKLLGAALLPTLLAAICFWVL